MRRNDPPRGSGQPGSDRRRQSLRNAGRNSDELHGPCEWRARQTPPVAGRRLRANHISEAFADSNRRSNRSRIQPVTSERIGPIRTGIAGRPRKGLAAMTTPDRIVVTRGDHSRLQAVLDRARQMGGESNRSLDELQRELNRAQVVDSLSSHDGIVVMKAQVRLRDVDTNEIQVYTLVYPQDADIRKNQLSILAPVGTAILGYRQGEVVTWSVPGGRVRLRIEEVLPPDSESIVLTQNSPNVTQRG